MLRLDHVEERYTWPGWSKKVTQSDLFLALASLQTQSWLSLLSYVHCYYRIRSQTKYVYVYSRLVFLSTFMPMIFLLFKFWSLANKSKRSMRNDYAEIFGQSLQKSSKIINKTIHFTSTTSWVISSGPLFKSSSDDNRNIITLLMIISKNCASSYCKRFVLVSLSLIYIISGLTFT